MVADPAETPLDPVALRVQARLRRLILISGLTLGIGIFAVLFAIVYRIAAIPTAAAPAAGATLRAAVSILPAGARLVGTNGDGNRLVRAR